MLNGVKDDTINTLIQFQCKMDINSLQLVCGIEVYDLIDSKVMTKATYLNVFPDKGFNP